ncbi:hypothetical protein [Circovirus-like genome DHCV-5]|uniref:hypothetical protein n=1 Tax=Circovirus-like genome DHCV-5 TaxID=1788454 RepID=UPI0007F98965|nr:hypothetical protein [Circovirus-like genome DHCV-5]AMB43008.1 hypothetical protein [Circovirus-like genome DHCV-5]
MTLLGKRKGSGRKGTPRKRPSIFARRPLTRARNKRPRTSKLGALTTYRYSRWASTGQTHDVSTTSYQGAATFTLDDVKGYTDFTSLYDQFMITHAQIHVTLITNPDSAYPINGTGSSAVINPNNWFPKLWYVFDSDDSSTLSLDVIRERQGVKYKTLRPNSTMIINIKPRCLVQTYRTATSTGYAPRRMFLDVATGYNVPHYGLKFCVDTMGLDPTDKFMVRMETKYWLKFKGVL